MANFVDDLFYNRYRNIKTDEEFDYISWKYLRAINTLFDEEIHLGYDYECRDVVDEYWSYRNVYYVKNVYDEATVNIRITTGEHYDISQFHQTYSRGGLDEGSINPLFAISFIEQVLFEFESRSNGEISVLNDIVETYKEPDGNRTLDVLESYTLVAEIISKKNNISHVIDTFHKINSNFGVPLEYHANIIDFNDNDVFSTELAPFWYITKDDKWDEATQCIIKARLDRDNYNNANKKYIAFFVGVAVESVIRTIIDEKNNTTNSSNTNYGKAAVNDIVTMGLITPFQGKILKDSIFSIRNEEGAHGQSWYKNSDPYTPHAPNSKEEASYLIESSMSWIKLLIKLS